MNFFNLRKRLIKRINIELLKKASDERKIKYLRGQGVKIGQNCHINTMSFSTEPYLIEIGDHVAISAGTDLVTHDGAIWCFREENENADIFGKIIIGNNVFIGINCTILPNTTIGNNCIVGAGSIVRGKFPDDTVIVGNPAKVIMKMSFQKFLYFQNPDLFATHRMPDDQKAKILIEHFSKKSKSGSQKL
jgi:acetyltransferase-like isoleucine patch superfamily enzyme